MRVSCKRVFILKMIIDMITNNEKIVGFVRKEEGFGGKAHKLPNCYVMINIQIGFLDRFCNNLDDYIKKQEIDMDKYGYRVLNPRGWNVMEKGHQSSEFFV